MSQPRTIGQYMLQQALPEDLQDIGTLNKKSANALFKALAETHPDDYVDVQHKLVNVGRDAATYYGRQASVGLRDMLPPPEVEASMNRLRERVNVLVQSPTLTPQQKSSQIQNLVKSNMERLRSEMMEKGGDNALVFQAKHGFRGNPLQASQILLGDFLVADQDGKPVPLPGLHGYGQGTKALEYLAGAYGSRSGYASVQFATAQTGYIGKILANMAQRQRITGDDCGAVDIGTMVDGADTDNIGSVLAKDIGQYKAGEVIDKQMLANLEDKQIVVRSLLTCQQPEGVCKKCAGKREGGQFPKDGDFVGITAASVISEPATQKLGLSAKHSGGSVGTTDQFSSGLKAVEQFLDVPAHFRGAAALAPVDGVVTGVKPAPQGGNYIFVGNVSTYVPNGIEVTATPGTKVEAGDVLSKGIPNPREIAEHKGLGEGRVYFARQFGKILADSGLKAHRRNLDAMGRGMMDRVRITADEGFQGYLPGDVIPYTQLQNSYEVRKGAATGDPGSLKNYYLEQPALHYTIGTRITPSVAKQLKDAGISQITAHAEVPGFMPEVKRAVDIPMTDPDWRTRMGAFRIKSSFLDAARHGSTSPNHSTSYIPQAMDPTLI